jgi:hypothetical protein
MLPGRHSGVRRNCISLPKRCKVVTAVSLQTSQILVSRALSTTFAWA